MFPRRNNSSQTTGTSRASNTAPNIRNDNLGPVPKSAAFLEASYLGIQYVITDPDSQYQKYLIIVIQLPSGIDPLNPPNITGVLHQGGQRFDITIPVCEALQTEDLLVNRKAPWMTVGGSDPSMYYSAKTTCLVGLGPTIVTANTFY